MEYENMRSKQTDQEKVIAQDEGEVSVNRLKYYKKLQFRKSESPSLEPNANEANELKLNLYE
jgi:hypothetical protein